MIRTYIALGSNLRNPLEQLRSAVRAIGALADSRIGKISTCYSGPAVGPGAQPDYLNAVLQLDTRLAPLALLTELQAIEQRQGRVRSTRWGPRTLDLDLLLYGDRRIDSERLVVPHPGMAGRNFVLYPLLEIAPANLMLPDGRDLGTLVAACPRGDLVHTALSLVIPDGAGPQ